MKVYKLYFVDEEADETRQEMFEGIQILAEEELKTVCQEYVEDETILPQTFESWKIDNDFDTVDFTTLPIRYIIDLLRFDGYSVEAVELP